MTSVTYVHPFIPKTPFRQDAPTKVVRLRKHNGEVYQNCDVYIGGEVQNSQWNLRKSFWNYEGKNLNQYKKDIEGNAYILSKIRKELKGKRLGHFCKPGRCHGDVLQEILEKENQEDKKVSDTVVDRWENMFKKGDWLVYYKGNRFLFCPSFNHNFYYRGKTFTSVLHAFEYERAWMAGNRDVAAKIALASSTAKATQLASSIKTKLKGEIQMMLYLVNLKYDQLDLYAKHCRKYVLTLPIDVSQNLKWGIGDKRMVDSFDDTEGLCDIKGENIMGWINKYIATKRVFGSKGLNFLERFLAYAKRTDQMYGPIRGLEKVMQAAFEVFEDATPGFFNTMNF